MDGTWSALMPSGLLTPSRP